MRSSAAPRLSRTLATGAWALGVGAVAFFWVFPLLWAFATSLRPPGQLGSALASLWVQHPTLANFREAWADAAYAFSRLEFWGRDLLFRLFLLQLMVAPSALILPNFITLRTLGLLNTRLG